MSRETNSVVVSWDIMTDEDGKDNAVLIVGRQNKGQTVVINAFQGEEAKKIRDLLITKKPIKN